MRTTIDATGRIVVPEPLRDEFSLSEGQELEISARDGRLEIDITPVGMYLEERDGAVTAVPDEEMPRLTARQVRELMEHTRR